MFLCAYIPDFPVEALARTEPDLRSHAVAVVAGVPPVVNVVASNDRARSVGVEPGITEMQAQERLRIGCEEGGWHVRQRSLDREHTAHAALLDCAGAFSPRVEATAPDTVIVDIAGLEPLFGLPATIARNFARRCSDAGLEVHVAVAGNPDTAAHAARGYSGITLIPEGKEAERLGPLPLDVLLVPQYGRQERPSGKSDSGTRKLEMEMIDTLDRWGVRTLRGLAALPEVALVERLGQPGLQWHRFATGSVRRELVIAQAPLSFEEVCELEYPVDLLEPLAFLLGRMLDQLCARLQSRALATHELHLRLQLDPEVTVDREGMPVNTAVAEATNRALALDPSGNSKPQTENCFIERSIKLPVPMLDSKTFLKLLQLDLKANPPTGPVLKLWLRAEPVRPKFDQRGLFLPLTPEPQKLEITLARLSGVTGGQENVGSPEVLDTHRPDAFRMARFAPPQPTHAKQQTLHSTRETLKGALDDAKPPLQPASALRRFRPPQPVSVTTINDRPGTIGPPRSPANGEQMARAVYGEVVWCAGPWRTSGEWWNHEPWEREEWDISVSSSHFQVLNKSTVTRNPKLEAQSAPLYRLYRNLLEGTWFIEGEYD